MNWLRLILILGGLDDSFNLLFLVGILSSSLIISHHNASLIIHRGSPVANNDCEGNDLRFGILRSGVELLQRR